jgi:lipid II:glycine glycyltransferase (peptidoglycan interpeptide bridge formation enzyme)
MKIDTERLASAFAVAAEAALKNQDLPAYMKKRWRRAMEKAKERLIEQPYFSWQPERLIIVSVPKEKTSEFGCRFYEATEAECRRIDKYGLCQAFFEGFPCWHRAAFLLLGIYADESCETQLQENQSRIA